MQLKSLLVVALAASFTLTATAQKKKTAKKPIKAAVINPAQPAAKSVDGATFSYAFGVAQGASLKQYLVRQMAVDSAYLPVAMEAMASNATEADRKKAEAVAAGYRIADMNKRNAPLINKQASGSESAAYFDQKVFEKGLCDVVLGRAQSMTADSAVSVVEGQIKYQAEIYKAANEAWLAANKKQKGVKTLPSGLQYRVLTEGKGAVATDSSEVEVNYEGKLIDGTVFDSSYKRNQSATFRPNQVIKGWTEALTMMPEGSTWELYIPASLGYGDRGSGQNIPGNSTLIFKVEVIKVKAPAPVKKR